MRYSIDTSSLILAWREQQPPDIFESVWKHVDGLIDDGVLRASEEVLEELKKKDDALLEWADDRPHLFIPTEEPIQLEVKKILKTHKKLIDERATRSSADPFIIGLAKSRNAAVVTNESPTNSKKRPHIPDVCKAYGIDCISFVDMLRAENFRT